MDDWQPIETAPKYGDYLVYQPEHKSGRNHLPARICLRDQAGFVRRSSHWIPLPAPPKSTPHKVEDGRPRDERLG